MEIFLGNFFCIDLTATLMSPYVNQHTSANANTHIHRLITVRENLHLHRYVHTQCSMCHPYHFQFMYVTELELSTIANTD